MRTLYGIAEIAAETKEQGMGRTKRAAPQVDGFDFSEDRVAVVIEPGEDSYWGPRWMVWHIRTDDTNANGWVRRDWLQDIEQGFEFGEEPAIEGFNYFPVA